MCADGNGEGPKREGPSPRLEQPEANDADEPCREAHNEYEEQWHLRERRERLWTFCEKSNDGRWNEIGNEIVDEPRRDPERERDYQQQPKPDGGHDS